ncbi:uncharacterized protein LOC144578848 [Callithrix jacchus]
MVHRTGTDPERSLQDWGCPGRVVSEGLYVWTFTVQPLVHRSVATHVSRFVLHAAVTAPPGNGVFQPRRDPMGPTEKTKVSQRPLDPVDRPLECCVLLVPTPVLGLPVVICVRAQSVMALLYPHMIKFNSPRTPASTGCPTQLALLEVTRSRSWMVQNPPPASHSHVGEAAGAGAASGSMETAEQSCGPGIREAGGTVAGGSKPEGHGPRSAVARAQCGCPRPDSLASRWKWNTEKSFKAQRVSPGAAWDRTREDVGSHVLTAPRGGGRPMRTEARAQDPSVTWQWPQPGPAAPQAGEKPRGAHLGVAAAEIPAAWRQRRLYRRGQPAGGRGLRCAALALGPQRGPCSRAPVFPPRSGSSLPGQRLCPSKSIPCPGAGPGCDRLSARERGLTPDTPAGAIPVPTAVVQAWERWCRPGSGGAALPPVRVLDAAGAHTPSTPQEPWGRGAAWRLQGHLRVAWAPGAMTAPAKRPRLSSELCSRVLVPRKPQEGTQECLRDFPLLRGPWVQPAGGPWLRAETHRSTFKEARPVSIRFRELSKK